ncbi:MAG: EAL domain-containing protein, partial [Motiliproteus sp.]
YETLQAKGVWEGEIWNRRKSGEAYPEWLAISTMRDEKGVFEGYVALFSDISKRKEDEARIEYQANFDWLTGLANRNLFSDRFSCALERAERDSKRVALLFIDLDRFKEVNDTLGHRIGDQLLQVASKRLLNSLRKSDTVARLGGDEFAVVLPDNLDMHNIEDAVIKILDSFSQPYCLEGHDAVVSASVGIAIYPDDGTDVETLLRKADSAMYKAKQKGRNNFQFFTLEMDVEAQQRRDLEYALRKALDNDEFVVNYQPIMDLSTGTLVGAEALVRWQRPGVGIVPPSAFIALAEEVGLIVPIGGWVLGEACREAKAWMRDSEFSPAVAVNFSSRQFQHQDVPGLVRDVLQDTGLPPEKLTIEITESLLIEDDERVLQQLQEIRSMGISLSIDDFGTGYSSLSYLKKFPINVLKIDRSFIIDLSNNTEDRALVAGIISMADSLNLKVVAEGVETAEQADFLKSKDCVYAQGFLYSQALPASEFNAYVETCVTEIFSGTRCEKAAAQ